MNAWDYSNFIYDVEFCHSPFVKMMRHYNKFLELDLYDTSDTSPYFGSEQILYENPHYSPFLILVSLFMSTHVVWVTYPSYSAALVWCNTCTTPTILYYFI